MVTMLKIWGIPFDILRLDQQRLQINRFLNGVAEPNYACVIWLADPDKLQGYSAHYETLRRVVEDYGISLIALFDHVRAPDVADLVGVEYEGAAAAPAAAGGGRWPSPVSTSSPPAWREPPSRPRERRRPASSAAGHCPARGSSARCRTSRSSWCAT